MKYRVRIQATEDCWLAKWVGDPGRTTKPESARTFNTRRAANLAITRAKQTHPQQERVYTIEEVE